MAKETKQDAIEQVQQGGVPEYLKREAGAPQAGLENLEPKDFTLPRLALCQAGSPQRKKSEPKYIAGLNDGMLFNSVTEKIYGDSVRIIPLFFFKSNILFRDMDDGGGMLCQAPDGKHGVGEPGGNCLTCPKAQFVQINGKSTSPECNGFFNYAVLITGENGHLGVDSLAIFSLKSTGLKAAKDWNAVMRLKGTDSFGSIYNVSTAEMKNSSGQTWYVPVIKDGGWLPEKDLPMVRGAYEAIRAMQMEGRLKIDAEEMANESSRQPGDEISD